MRIVKRVLLGLLICLLLTGMTLTVWHPVHAQEIGTHYFSQTGHWVLGNFWAFYDGTPNALQIYGYPITDEFTDVAVTNKRVQYFQRAIFTMEDNGTVKLAPVGVWLYEEAQVEKVAMPTDTPACRTIPSPYGAHAICYAFLNFYDSNGGYKQFGYPISDFVKEDDLYVQYFENARFEWHPELSSDQWVRLTDLGRIHFDILQDPSLLLPNTNGNATIGDQVELQAHAYVDQAVIKNGSSQKISVVVLDQTLQPVAGARLSALVHLPDGSDRPVLLPDTNADGISQNTFNVDGLTETQIVDVEIVVTYSGKEARTATWFRIWW